MAWHTLKAVVILLAALIVPPAQAAKLYKWVDEHGNVSYQDKPPPAGQGKVTEKIFGEKGDSTDDPTMADAARKAPITLYVTRKCSSCDTARNHLRKRKVPFTEIDVSETNVEAQQEMTKKVGQLTVPTIVIGTKIMKGYMDSLVDGELDAAGYPKPVEKQPEAADGAAPAPASPPPAR